MLRLFYKKDDTRYSELNYGNLDYMRYNVNSIFYILKSYYSTCKRYVRRPNMLISLLGSLGIDLSKAPSELYESVSMESIYASSDFKIINGVRTEQEFNSDTIIYNTKELFVYSNDRFNFLDKNIVNEPSITCISSNSSDIFLTHPQMYKGAIYESDLYTYVINVDMLAMQYYYWCKEQLEMELDIDEARFIYEVVLTNTIESIYDANIINRIININNSLYVNKFVNDNPFFIKDVGKKIDKLYLLYLKHLRKKHDLYYKEILDILPALTSGSIYDTLVINEIYFSRRNKWVYILSRLNIVNFLLRDFKSKKETAYHNDILLDFSHMTRNKYLITNNDEINSIIEKKEDELKQILFV